MLALRTPVCLWLLALSGCGSVPGQNGALRGLPERRDAPVDLQSDTDLDAAFDDYYALSLDAHDRSHERRTIWKATDTRIQRLIKQDKDNEAFDLMMRALSLWHPSELGDAKTSPADLALVVPVAKALHARFARGGDTTPAMATLAVLIAVEPQQQKIHHANFAEMASFLEEMADPADGPVGRHSLTIGALEEICWQFPSQFVASKLTSLYLERQATLHQAIKSGGNTLSLGNSPSRTARRAVSFPLRQPVLNIMRAHLLAGRLPETLPVLERLRGQEFVEDKIVDVLGKFLAAKTTEEAAPAWEALLQLVLFSDGGSRAPSDRSLMAALRLGENGLMRFPKAAKQAITQARVAAQMGRPALSTRWAEHAFGLSPKDDALVMLMVQLYINDMGHDITAERPDAAAQKLVELEAFYAKVTRLLGKLPDDMPPLAEAHVTLANAYSAVGDMAAAERSLARALAGPPVADALEQLGTYALKRGQYAVAISKLAAAGKPERPTPQATQRDAVRLGRLLGQAHSGAGDKEAARKAWTAALSATDELLSLFDPRRQLDDRDRAIAGQIFGERARLFYFLGYVNKSLDAFETSVDFNEESPVVYADAIAFMLTRGHYDRALDAYHRALGRSSVTEYYKVYSTLWIVMYARAMDLDPDPFALRYLNEREGTLWLHDLARWATHKITFDALYRKADTRGKRAEAYMYEGLASYGKGKRSDAEKYLRYVIATDMVNFFEYDMARYLLAHGPPKKR